MIREQFFIREWSKIFITKRDYLQRYRSQTKIMPNFSLTGSRTMFEEWEWNYLSKNRNNNTDIFLVCGFVRNSCTERSNRYFDRWNEKKSFPRVFLGGGKRTVVTDRGRKKEEKRERGKKYDDAIYSPGKVSCLRNDSRYASRRTRQRFQLYPLRRLLAAFYFAARRSAVKLRRYNRVSRFEEKSVAAVGAYRFFQSAIDCLRRVSRYHRRRLVFSTGGIFLSIQRNFRSIEFEVSFFPIRSKSWNRQCGFVVIIKIKAHGFFSHIIPSRDIYENCTWF